MAFFFTELSSEGSLGPLARPALSRRAHYDLKGFPRAKRFNALHIRAVMDSVAFATLRRFRAFPPFLRVFPPLILDFCDMRKVPAIAEQSTGPKGRAKDHVCLDNNSCFYSH